MVWRWERTLRGGLRRLSTARRRRLDDEGDWSYSSEWWGSDTDHLSHSIFRSTSHHGNGVVSVLSYPSSTPRATDWHKTEDWVRRRCMEIYPHGRLDLELKVLGYQWRVLRFNDTTRQSTAKVLVVSNMSDPDSVYYMQQAHCLAVPYVKSMVSAGLTALLSCNYNLVDAVHGKKKMRVLCVGHGGGSLPLFLASTIKGAVVDIVEIDPIVISASVNEMGFPSYTTANHSDYHACMKPRTIDEIFWRGIHNRLFLYESDAELFILDTKNQYDIVFIDAYDGDDIFPRKLWDPDSVFLKTLSNKLHPSHGTVVVNLHSDTEILNSDEIVTSDHRPLLPMGKYVSIVCRSYKDMLVGKEIGGVGFAVSVPWVCNTTFVVSRGFGVPRGTSNSGQDFVLNTLVSNSLVVERDLDFPFSCLGYLKRGFVLLD